MKSRFEHPNCFPAQKALGHLTYITRAALFQVRRWLYPSVAEEARGTGLQARPLLAKVGPRALFVDVTVG